MNRIDHWSARQAAQSQAAQSRAAQAQAAQSRTAQTAAGRRPRPAAPKKPIGPLALPMPSETARVESLDDGSLQIRDDLTREGVGRFLLQTGDLVREGLMETPAWFGTSLRDGGSVRFDRGEGADAGARLADAMTHMGQSVLDGRIDPASAAFSLDCGCGVKVQRVERV